MFAEYSSEMQRLFSFHTELECILYLRLGHYHKDVSINTITVEIVIGCRILSILLGWFKTLEDVKSYLLKVSLVRRVATENRVAASGDKCINDRHQNLQQIFKCQIQNTITKFFYLRQEGIGIKSKFQITTYIHYNYVNKRLINQRSQNLKMEASCQSTKDNPVRPKNKKTSVLLEINFNTPTKCMTCTSPNKPQRNPSLPSRNVILAEKTVELKRGNSYKQKKKLTETQFQKIGVIGQGGFGSVYLVKRKSGQNTSEDKQNEFAMKIIPKRSLNQTKTIGNLILEKRILSELHSDFIAKLKYSFQNKHNCYMVMQYAPSGDLYSFLYNAKQPKKMQMFRNLGQQGVRFVMGCVVLGLQTLHCHNIMYRDLKPENVLIFEDGYAKLTDFGLAQESKSNETSNTMAGTRVYLPPEVIEDGKYTKLIDLWALGVFCYEMIFFETPFDPMYIAPRRFRKRCLKQEKQRIWKSCISDQAKNLISQLLRVNPNQRLGANSFDQIKSHSFFRNFDWKSLKTHTMISPLSIIIKQFGPIKPKQKSLKSNKSIQDEEFETIPNIEYFEQAPEQTGETIECSAD